jgi:hypothetical protein
LVQAKADDHTARGHSISKDKIHTVVERVGDKMHMIGGGAKQPWSEDRSLSLCWKGSINEWLLQEDSEAAVLFGDR